MHPIIRHVLYYHLGRTSPSDPLRSQDLFTDPPLGSIIGLSAIDDADGSRARPAQAGSRITVEWLESLPRMECLYRFRLFSEEIIDLAAALRIPDPFITASRSRFTQVEVLGLLLARLRSSGDMYELTIQYDRPQSAISEAINELVCFLDDYWKALLSCDPRNHVLSPQRLAQYAKSIHEAGAPLPTIWSFIDCTVRSMCRPTYYQQQAYNGYKGEHALKFQAVKLPNGLIGLLHGPHEGRRNDNHLLADSGILDWCYAHAHRPGTSDATPLHQRYFQIFGDPAYGVSPILMSPFAGAGERTQEEKLWNEAMAKVQIEVEHGFADITRLWPFLNTWWKQKVFHSPVGRYYRIGVLLFNAVNCLRPSQTAQCFNCPPPSLEEYFTL
ncbi:hypothetical protein BDZ89DRAFT_1099976 [Hymenopellis radicata]|nr:hypothetical protein BDZ89DRAFT_1159818 [Hymenopellis radicata]KAF9041922.1 hypothetical protein BDZ89DRAFT_1099976 [Hymenopellis radicata]